MEKETNMHAAEEKLRWWILEEYKLRRWIYKKVRWWIEADKLQKRPACKRR